MVSLYPAGVINEQLIAYFMAAFPTVQTLLEVVTEVILAMQVASLNNIVNGSANTTSVEELASVPLYLASSVFTVFGLAVATL